MKNTSKKAMAEILRKAEQYGETPMREEIEEPETAYVNAPEETGPVTVPPFCHYEICRDGTMELCGADATETGPDLCAEHAAFVKDSTEGPFTASKKAHPANFDWLKKAKAAFGVKPFTMGKPSDAGKPAHNPVSRAECDAWAARVQAERIARGEIVPSVHTVEIVNVDTPEPEHIEPLPVDVYCVQIKVYGEWRTQKAGLEGAAAGNMRDGMARMGYEARVMYGPGVVADPVEIKEAEPAHIGQDEPQPVEAGNGEYTREEIEAACVRLMEEKDTYRGTGIPGVLWNVGFRIVYQKRAGSDAQIAFIRALIAKKPEKYAPLLV